MNQKYKRMALDELGRRAFLPPEALLMIEGEAQEVLRDWLKEANAPEQVQELYDALNGLSYLMRVPPETFPVEGRAQWNTEMRVTVSVVCWGIKVLGGKFGDTPCKGFVEPNPPAPLP